jgi:hypothetical protein
MRLAPRYGLRTLANVGARKPPPRGELARMLAAGAQAWELAVRRATVVGPLAKQDAARRVLAMVTVGSHTFASLYHQRQDLIGLGIPEGQLSDHRRWAGRASAAELEKFPDNFRYPATLPIMAGCHLRERRHVGAIQFPVIRQLQTRGGAISEQRLAVGGGNASASAWWLGGCTGLERRLDGGGDELCGLRVDRDVVAEQHAADDLPGVPGRVLHLGDHVSPPC